MTLHEITKHRSKSQPEKISWLNHSLAKTQVMALTLTTSPLLEMGCEELNWRLAGYHRSAGVAPEVDFQGKYIIFPSTMQMSQPSLALKPQGRHCTKSKTAVSVTPEKDLRRSLPKTFFKKSLNRSFCHAQFPSRRFYLSCSYSLACLNTINIHGMTDTYKLKEWRPSLYVDGAWERKHRLWSPYCCYFYLVSICFKNPL